MAVATGSQIRPELSAVDYTPFLQAAGQGVQMQAQGIGSAIGGALKGLESYQKNVQEERQAQGIIKSAGSMYKSFVPILDKVNPDIAVGLQDIMQRISDPSVSTKERAAAAQSMMASAPMLLNAGLEYFKINEAERMKRGALEEQRNIESNDQAVIARGLAPFIGSQGNPPERALTPEDVPQIMASIVGGGISTKGIERVDSILKALSGPSQTKTEVDKLYNSKVNAFKSVNKREPDDIEKSQMYSQSVTEHKSGTNINIGEGAATKAYTDLNSTLSTLSSLNQVSANYKDAIREITKEGAFSGVTGALQYAGARALQFFGADKYKTEADAYQAAASAIADNVLAIAKTLPGAASDRDVIFLTRVQSGDERVASPEALRKLQARVDRKIERMKAELEPQLAAFGEQAAKGDPNTKFYYGLLSSRYGALSKPKGTSSESGDDVIKQADEIINR